MRARAVLNHWGTFPAQALSVLPSKENIILALLLPVNMFSHVHMCVHTYSVSVCACMCVWYLHVCECVCATLTDVCTCGVQWSTLYIHLCNSSIHLWDPKETRLSLLFGLDRLTFLLSRSIWTSHFQGWVMETYYHT